MRLRPIALLLAALFVGGLVFYVVTRDGARRPNVLLISIDSLRQDMVGAYGFESPYAPGISSSPNIDRLAAEGLLLENAHSTTSWTLPSHMTLLTGVPEILHGVDIDNHAPDEDFPLLSEYLQDEGYRTSGFYSGPYLSADPWRFDRGFDTYEACYGDDLKAATLAKAKLIAEAKRRESGEAGLPTTRQFQEQLNQAILREEVASHNDISTKNVTDAALAAIDAAVEEGDPFFVFAHLFDPHYDYIPPATFASRFDPEYQGAVTGKNFMGNAQISLPNAAAGKPGARTQVASQRDMEHIRALYAGELAWVDDQIRRLLEKLEEKGLRENTIVIVTSDHGDEFFEHGSLGHRNTLYEEITRIPMIISWPEQIKVPRKLSTLVSNVDLAPTILDWLDISHDMRGASLAPLLEGRRDLEDRRIIGRMVRAWPMGITVPNKRGEPQQFPAEMITHYESFHHGTIKILREVQWPRVGEAVRKLLSPATVTELDTQKATAKANQVVRWIDLAFDPTERDENWSTDFSAPAAREALDEFQRVYRKLNAERSEEIDRDDPSFVDTSSMQGLIKGTGYAGSSDEQIPQSEFALGAPRASN